MKKIFIGLIFVFCNVSIFTINVLPDFVGYILIFLGLDEEFECPSLAGSRTIAVASAILSAVMWVVGLLRYGMAFPLGAILQLLITYRLVLWTEEQAPDQNWDGVQTRRFRLGWYALAGTMAAVILLNRVSMGLGMVWAVAAIAAVIYYIYTFYKLWKTAAPAED